MPKRQREEEETPAPEKPFASLAPKVAEEVLSKLGKPPSMVSCVAVPLFDNRFRVNIRANSEGGDRIVDSFFIHATEEGIVSSDPEIKQKYAVPKPAPPIRDDEIVVEE